MAEPIRQTPVLARALSRLESLPIELIQIIFLHCLEFNLPGASIHIARALSDPLLYTWLIRLVFSSLNAGGEDGFLAADYIPPPLNMAAFARPSQERRELQTAILQSRWCTLPLIRKCQTEFLKRAIAHHYSRLALVPEDQHTLLNLQYPPVDKTGCIMDAHKYMDGSADLRVNAQLARTGAPCEIGIHFHFGAVTVKKPFYMFADEMFCLPSCSSTARMPDKLFRPPLTEDKLEFLNLFSTYAWIDEDSSCLRSRRVLHRLIRDRDFATFERLLTLFVVFKEQRAPRLWPVLTGHFRLALQCANGKSDLFVKFLVENRWADIPDDELQLKDELLRNAGRCDP